METQDSPSSSSQAEEAHELDLLERVFLRFGTTKNDEQLKKNLEKFLVPVILKITSPHKSVQDKVMELLTHVNKQLKNCPGVVLPLDDLLSRFQDPESPAQVVNFVQVYIRMMFSRLPPKEQGEAIPKLLRSLAGRTPLQQDGILRLCVPAMEHLQHKTPAQMKAIFSFDDRESPIREVLMEFLFFYLLLPYGELNPKSTPPGLSVNQVARVTGGDHTIGPDSLEKVKLVIIKLLTCEVFGEEEVFCHLLVGAADPRHSVSDSGTHKLKQFAASVNWENPSIIARLFHLCQGTVAIPGKRPRSQTQPQQVDPRDRVSPTGLRMRLLVLPYFLKSTLAANSFPSCVQVVFDCLFGPVTNNKLRSQALYFVHHICTRAQEQKLSLMAPVLLTGLNKITNQLAEEQSLRVLAYTGIGLLAKRAPTMFKKDTAHLTKLFDALKEESNQDILLAVQECLSMVGQAYKSVVGTQALIVEALLLENICSENSQSRLAAVHYAQVVFPFSHIPSRFVCMLACGDSKDEVKEEGRKGLRLHVKRPEETQSVNQQPPDFVSMVKYFHNRCKLSMQSGGQYKTDVGTLPYPPPVLSGAIQFLRACLSASACVTEEQKLTNQMLPSIAEYLSALEEEQVVSYMDILKHALKPAGSSELHSVAMQALLEAAAASLNVVVPQLLASVELQWVKGFTRSSSPETRQAASRLLAILAVHTDRGKCLELAKQTLEDTTSDNYSTQHGAVVSLGHLVGSCLGQLGPGCHDVGSNGSMESMETSDTEMIVVIRKAIRRLTEFLGGGTPIPQLLASALGALGDIFRSGPVPLPDGGVGVAVSQGRAAAAAAEGKGQEEKEKEEEVAVVQAQAVGSSSSKAVGALLLSKRDLVEMLAAQLTAAKEVKSKEACVLTMGLLPVGDPAFPHKKPLVTALFRLREEKGHELHFTVGEALSCVCAGRLSPIACDPWRLPSNTMQQISEAGDAVMDDTLSWTLNTIFSKYIGSNTNSLVRQASCVWLLSLLKHCSKHPDMQGFLPQIQATFLNVLGEKNEVIQEVASRGLGLVYELSSSPSHRKELVEVLVGTLMEGRRPVHHVTGNTELFHTSLGKSPTGGQLNTYKELCSLASDLNQPDLVYKFMNLANHHALWNSKKGAAFGFSTIMSQAREQLEPHVPTLVPRLYRYKHDPNPQIQQAMASIWKAIVTENKKTVDKYFTEIMKDLTHNLNNHLWRNREASCLALGDLLVSRQAKELVEYLPELWELCLRVRDDIKESVRKAASIACRVLLKVTVHACDEAVSTGGRVVEGVLPMLLQKGMVSASTEIRVISLEAVLKISRNALLGALVSGLSDRSLVVRKDNARAIGYLVKAAKGIRVTKLIEKMKKWYLEAEPDSPHKASVPLVLSSIATHSPDTAKDHAVEIVPLVFLGMHERPVKEDPSSEERIKRWKETWQELVTGTESGMVRLYLGELVATACPALGAQSWLVKAQGAAAVAAIAEKMGSSLSSPHLATMLSSLTSALPGQVWDGKEAVLKALESVVVTCCSAVLNSVDTNQPSAEEIARGLFQQCKKRGHSSYRKAAIGALGEVLQALELDMFSELSSILLPLINPASTSAREEDSDDEGEEERSARQTARLDLQAVASKAIGKAWPNTATTQAKHFGDVCRVFSVSLGSTTWKGQVAILSGLQDVFSKLCVPIEGSEEELLSTELLPTIDQCLRNNKYSAVRHQALLALEKILPAYTGTGEPHSTGTGTQAPLKLAETTRADLIDSLASFPDHRHKELALAMANSLKLNCDQA